MSKIGIFMANGCEEIEALTVVDILRRAGIQIDMISIAGTMCVCGSHGIEMICNKKIEEADLDTYEGLILPGGMPGTTNLGANETVVAKLKAFAEEGKLVAAICAAPSYIGNGAGLWRMPFFRQNRF